MTSTPDLDALQRLPLAALRVFVAVAQAGSMTAAAERLSLSTAAVSMQMRALAREVGAALFVRRGRGVMLTDVGERLLPGVSQGLAQLAQSLQAARGVAAEPALRVTLLSSFLQLWLVPRLPRLAEAEPSLRLHWHTSRDHEDLSARGFSAAIRLGRGAWPGCRTRLLMAEGLLPVAAPGLLPRLRSLPPAPLPPGLPLLHSSVDPWSHWSGEPANAGANSHEDTQAVLAAALDGQGLALARLSLALPALLDGRLRALHRARPYRFQYRWVTPAAASTAQAEAAERLHRWLRREALAWQRSVPAALRPLEWDGGTPARAPA